ncbi:MAG: peptide deformylase [Gemmatimonadales bacterium]|jgi:peptide deformylase|nr:MAG: peptide deformylase [Gemmatimonadales bacterium]
MALHEIVLMGDPVLRQEAEPVADEEFGDELRALVNDMFETMYHADGVGLAAPQIGISKRIMVVDVRDPDEPHKGKYALVNPRVVVSSRKREKDVEGCLSIPGLEEMVERPWAVEVEARDPEGNEVLIDAQALLARALQHEIDHLDGILFPDRVSPLKRRMLLKKWKKLQEED